MNLCISFALRDVPCLLILAAMAPLGVKAYQCDVLDSGILNNVSSRNYHNGPRWPHGIVKYQFHRSLTANDRLEVQRAFNDIQSKTCIRFRRRARGELDYTSIEQVGDTLCGYADPCYHGSPQFTVFGQTCRDWNTMVHELGHTLCLGHEHSRRDRDEYLHFDNCSPTEIPEKDRHNNLLGSLYDYTSQMHYDCGECQGGWPRQSGVTRCGPQVQQGLSVMDADKLNDLYDCGGCYAHRWRPIDALTPEDRRNLVRFGDMDTGEAFYACRGVINGELCVGKYSFSSAICYLPYGGREHQFRKNAQVFTNPSRGSSYRVVNIKDYREGRVSGRAVRSGNTREANVGYIAVANIERGGRRELAIGKVFERNWNEAHFPILLTEVKTNNYGIVVCG